MFRQPTPTDPRRPALRRGRAVPGLLLAALATLAGLALAPAPAQAESSVGTRSARASIDLRIVIPPVLRMRMIRQPARIVVTEHDAKAGYVELPEGMELEVVSNLRSGHAMMFHVASSVVKAVVVSGLGAPVSAGHEAATVRFPRATGGGTRTLHSLGFRLQLAGNVVPGVYDWPVSLTIIPA